MEILELLGAREFSSDHHLQRFLKESSRCSVSVACWEPGQSSPIHSHPGADEVYHVLEGEGFFRDPHSERKLGPGGTVFFPSDEVHQVRSLTRMVLYRVQAGLDRKPRFFTQWP